MEEVAFDASHPERKVKIGADLPKAIRSTIVAVLEEFRVIFAWGPEDMPVVDWSIIRHWLFVDLTAKPVKQKKRYMSTKRREFVKKVANMLLTISHVWEVGYPEWLANVVLAPKPPTWCMCVNYLDLNKACLMDPFSLPRIDILVDEPVGCVLLSFMDEGNEEKTAFIMLDVVFCYLVMAFNLKNSVATYTRMVTKLFGEFAGQVHGGLHGRYAHEEKGGEHPCGRSDRLLSDHEALQPAPESKKVCIRRARWQVPRLHGHSMGNQVKS